QLEAELLSTTNRAQVMSAVAGALPDLGDKTRLRAYNWKDVQDLQEVLLSSVENMSDSDAKVGQLRTKLMESLQQKKEVLDGGATEAQAGGVGAEVLTPTEETGVRAFQASVEMSEKELLGVAADSSKSAVVGVAKGIVAGASSLGEYAKSPDAQMVAASAVDIFGAISGTFKSLKEAFDAGIKEYQDNTLPG
ncbi:unnamed protein product, partial [Discosporangium mesarthrocarpum]